jgi:hypothetical protein
MGIHKVNKFQRAKPSFFQIQTEEYTYILFKNHFINTVTFRNISAIKGLFSGGTVDRFQKQDQQNE